MQEDVLHLYIAVDHRLRVEVGHGLAQPEEHVHGEFLVLAPLCLEIGVAGAESLEVAAQVAAITVFQKDEELALLDDEIHHANDALVVEAAEQVQFPLNDPPVRSRLKRTT